MPPSAYPVIAQRPSILDQSEKDISLLSKKDISNVLHRNLYSNKFIALKFDANLIIHAETRPLKGQGIKITNDLYCFKQKLTKN